MTLITSEWSTPISFEVELYESFPDTEIQKILSGEPSASGGFSCSIAIDSAQTTLIVGEKNADPGGLANAGAAHIYVKSGNTWVRQAKLVPSDSAAGDQFGFAVAISGDGNLVSISAPYNTPATGRTQKGTVYTYKRSGVTWSYESRYSSASDTSGQSPDVWTGTRLAMSRDGQILVVQSDGAEKYEWVEGSGWIWTDVGAVEVLKRGTSSWTPLPQDTSEFQPESSDSWIGRGIAVSADGSRIVFSRRYTNQDAPVVCVYDRNIATDKWELKHTITRAAGFNAAQMASFGIHFTLSQDGTFLVISAYRLVQSNLSSSGGVFFYRFANNAWNYEGMLQASVAQAAQYFGYRTALSQDKQSLLVGAYGKTVNGFSQAGMAFFYQRENNTWVLKHELKASDPAASNQFSKTLALSENGRVAYIGCESADNGGIADVGAVYVFN